MANNSEFKQDVLLSVRHLKQYFKSGRITVKAVDDVSFDVMQGEVLGLVGESGCGKTTTGRTIIKLYEATDGDVFFKGTQITAGVDSIRREIEQAKKAFDGERTYALKRTLDQAKKINKKYGPRELPEIQMIFQDPIASLNPRMTVREIIAEGLTIRGVKDKAEIDRKVYEVLDLVGLVPEHASRYPHEFSGGQRQRIGIARAIVLEPELIIADEPISALDVSIQAQVINLLNDLRHKLGLTILFIAHDLSVVKYFSDRIAVMYYGKIVELTTSEELFRHPLHPYTRSLLSAIPMPDPHYEKNRKRISYNPKVDDDHSEEAVMREILPGHMIRCTSGEFAKYQEEIAIKP